MTNDGFQIEGDSPVRDELMFWRIVGHEALSRPSSYELTVLSKNPKIDAKNILGWAFNVVIAFFDAEGKIHDRNCQGHAIRFTRVGEVGRYYRYEISLQSWFGLLSKRTNSRIHQNDTVLEVFKSVLEDSAIERVKKTDVTDISDSHPKRPYCVQHQETDYQFLSRLLEDEGIYYWFDRYGDGTMHLSDNSLNSGRVHEATEKLRYVPNGVGNAWSNEVTQWVSAQQFDTGGFSSSDSDFKAIRTKLTGDTGDMASHELADLQVFEFTGGFFKDDNAADIAFRRMDEMVTRRQRHWAHTSWPDVTIGQSVTFENDPDGNRDGEYLIAACSFVVSHPGYEGISLKEEPRSIAAVLQNALEACAVNAAGRAAYAEFIRNSTALRTGVPGTRAFLLTVLPQNIRYVVPRLTPKVTMPGPQSAIVVGPAGDEICADDFGRVKVHFHWDRYDKSDKNSSCWVRVSQPWAGKGWGGYFIPRIGQEVIVDFLNGDPDRPIIVGRVYNDDQPKPFDSHTQSGFRTRSTPKGTAKNANEFRFDDEKGAEQVFLHAERNLDTEVEANETRDVGHDRKTHIHNNETLDVDADRKTHVKGHFTETIDTGEERTVHAGFKETIDGSETRKVDGGMKETISGGLKQTITGGETRDVSGSMTETVNGGLDQTINGGEFRKVTGYLNEAVTGPLTQKVSGPTNITSLGPMTITAPAGLTVVAPGGTKFIDQFFSATGANRFNTYGVNWSMAIAKVDQAAISHTSTGVKIEISLCKMEQRAFWAQNVGIAMATKATVTEIGAASIYSKLLCLWT